MIDIVGQVDQAKERKIRMWPCRSNRASEMGHPCKRYLVYLRTHGNDRMPHDVGLQYIFDEGNLHEEAVLDALRMAGIKVIEQQRAFEWPEYDITGRIDAKIIEDEIVLPIEIKSSEPHAWGRINTVQDMLNSNKIWWQKYPSQMYLYLLMDNKEQGAFILKNKVNGRLKQVNIQLDYGCAEGLIKKAETINSHLANKTLPEGIEPDENICGYCGFSSICMPDRDFGAALQTINDDRLMELLAIREELMPNYREYGQVDKQIKAAVKDQPNILVGDWHITGKVVQRKGYEVKDTEYWQSKIVRLNKTEEAAR